MFEYSYIPKYLRTCILESILTNRLDMRGCLLSPFLDKLLVCSISDLPPLDRRPCLGTNLASDYVLGYPHIIVCGSAVRAIFEERHLVCHRFVAANTLANAYRKERSLYLSLIAVVCLHLLGNSLHGIPPY